MAPWTSFCRFRETNLAVEACSGAAGRRGDVFARATGGRFMKAILFVDDHEVLARLSCEILEMQGYRAVSAYSAEEALQKFDQEKFDVLVTDFRMEGMNGLELAQRVRAKNPQIPVIIVTGYGPIEGGKEVDACLAKEQLFPSLLEKIKMFLGDREESQEPAPVG
jgi:CheY-like chemotaxis protein